MTKFIFGFAIGFLLASLLAIPCAIFVMREKYAFGHNNGMLEGENEVIAFLSKHFEVRYPPDNPKDSLITKPGGLFVIKENGALTIKTIRY